MIVLPKFRYIALDMVTINYYEGEILRSKLIYHGKGLNTNISR